MTQDGLQDKYRQAILDILTADPDVQRVVLFGSRAMGTFTPTSDIDIALFGPALTIQHLGKLSRTLEQSTIPQTVDLLIYDQIESKKLVQHIKKHGVKWFDRNDPTHNKASKHSSTNNVIKTSGTGGRSREMGGEWKSLSFSDAVTINPKVKLKKGVVYPFVEMAALTPGILKVSESENRLFTGGGSRFESGDTLMARITPCLENGKISRFYSENLSPIGFGSTEFIVIRGKDKITTNDFAYYLTILPEFHRFAVSQMIGSSGRQRVPAESLSNFQLQIPPINEQKHIAHILGTLDDKIELNRRMNRTLEQMAAAIFKSWFIDFDPVHAKANGDQPTGIDPATAKLFPKEFEDSELGMIPKGWKRVPIGDLCDVNASTLSKSDKLSSIEYVEISAVSRGTIGSTTYYVRGKEPSRARRRLRHGDTVLSTVRPDREAYFLALDPPPNRIASTGFAVFTPIKAPWAYVHAFLTDPDIFPILGRLADGGAYPAVKPEQIGALQVNIPDNMNLLNEFQGICGPLFEQAEANRQESRTLAQLRDTLLPKLLSGEIELSTDENHILEIS